MRSWKRNSKVNDDSFVESDPVFKKFCELREEKDSQYELEARQIISEKQLTKIFGKYLVNYKIDNGFGSFELIDPEKPNEIISGNYGPLSEKEEDLIFEFKSYLAQSEAIALSKIAE